MKTNPDRFEFEFEGSTYEADRIATKSWKVVKGMVSGGPAMFDAFDALFCGRSDEYAELMGDDLMRMAELANAAIEAADSKN